MATSICPNGHLSEAADYCDQCGAKIGGDPNPPAGQVTAQLVPDEVQAGPTKACPACGTPNAESDKFCESCGYDMTLGPPAASPEGTPTPEQTPVPATWQAVVVADRDYYDRVEVGDIPFPAVYPDRVFALSAARAVIGKRSVSRGINPEIDLSGSPEDPGVSRMHAVLVGGPDGGWSLIDPGSSNGTFLNESTDPIPNNKEVPVGDGDRIHMGAWTTLTLRRS